MKGSKTLKRIFKSQITLSVVALLVIVMLGMGMTYSWIEGGTTYLMKTEEDNLPSTQEKLPESLDYAGTIELNPSETDKTIELVNNYDETTNLYQNLHFSPVSSIDGENFFFPIGFDEDGNATAYRKSNTNDIGTKLIKFKFNYKAAKKSYIAFDGEPVITAKQNGVEVTGDATSAFRVMMKKTAGNKSSSHIMAPISEDITKSGITGVNATTSNYTVEPFSNYKYISSTKNRIFEFDENEEGTIEVAVWLDSQEDVEKLSKLYGRDIELKLNIVVKQPEVTITYDAVTYDNEDNLLTNGFTGGKINDNGTLKSATFSKNYVVGTDFSVIATLNETGVFSGESYYKFVGWYTDKACTKQYTTSATLSDTATENVTYYAKFVEKDEYYIYVSQKTTPRSTGGTVYVGDTAGVTQMLVHDGCSVYVNATKESGFAFEGWHKNDDCSDSAFETTAKAKVTVKGANYTYYAHFIQEVKVTLKARADGTVGTGGKVTIDSETASTSVTKTVPYGTTVTLTADPAEGYDFVTFSNANGAPITRQYTVLATVTVYADFEKHPETTTTIYFEDRYSGGTHSAWVYNANDESIVYSSSKWPGSTAPLDSTTGLYKFEFTTTDVGEFRVIVSKSGNNQYPGKNQDGLLGDIGGSYLFTKGNQLIEFTPADMITVEVTKGTGGSTATVNGGSSAKVVNGSKVTLEAVAASGYTFDGWYLNGSNVSSKASDTVTIDATKGSTVTYEAKFKKEEAKKLYLKPNSNWTKDNARFAAYFYGNGETWVSMTAVSDESGVYECAIPDGGYTNVIFCRMDPSTTANNRDNKWNQTGNLTIPTNSNNLFTVPSGAWNGSTSGWGTK